MKTLHQHIIRLIAPFLTLLLLGGCGGEDCSSSSSAYYADTYLIIQNRSQFPIEHLFVYEMTSTYQESVNLIETELGVNEMIFHRLPEGEYYVTVSRRPNATGDLLAYTTDKAILLDRPKVVEYYDTEYRIYDLKLTVPTESSLTENNETDLTIQRAGRPKLEGSLPFIEVPME